MGRVFANGSENLGSIPGCVVAKTFKMVLDPSLLNIQQCKVRIKVKVEQSRERSSPLHLGVVTIEKGALWSPLTTLITTLIANKKNNNQMSMLFKIFCIPKHFIMD